MMTEAEFLQQAGVGTSINRSVGAGSRMVCEALETFLRSNGHHEAARSLGVVFELIDMAAGEWEPEDE